MQALVADGPKWRSLADKLVTCNVIWKLLSTFVCDISAGEKDKGLCCLAPRPNYTTSVLWQFGNGRPWRLKERGNSCETPQIGRAAPVEWTHDYWQIQITERNFSALCTMFFHKLVGWFCFLYSRFTSVNKCCYSIFVLLECMG